MQNVRPKILLIGAGRFGRQHLRVLLELQKLGMLELIGVVVKTQESRVALEREHGVQVVTKLSDTLLKSADGVVIVTPGETHEQLVTTCIPYCHVLVEKPITLKAEHAKRLVMLAKKHKKVLMVGHTFRFHPLMHALKKALQNKRIIRVTGRFVSPIATYRDQNAFFEDLHLFDMLDMIFNKEPTSVWSSGDLVLAHTHLRYPNNVDAKLVVGWQGEEKTRALSFITNTETITADFVTGTLTQTGKAGKINNVQVYEAKPEPLRLEHETFIKSILANKCLGPADGVVGARIVSIAERATQALTKRPKVAIIGGGIFGLTTAIKFGKHYDVTVFERHADVMKEASRANQHRHHAGYHYPRSLETIEQIQQTRADFENFYKSVVVSTPSFYCVAKSDSHTSVEDLHTLCEKMGLPADVRYPSPSLLDPASVQECIETSEDVYDYEKLKKVALEKIQKNKRITLKLNHEITNATIAPNGKKILTVTSNKTGAKNKEKKGESFDIVINATYAHYNRFCKWLNMPQKDLEYRFKELAIIEIPNAPREAVTIIDGPFATIVPIGKTGLFTLGDVPLSVHRTVKTFNDATFKKWHGNAKPRWQKMFKRCAQWFPALKDAKYIRSMYVTLPVESMWNATDARKSSIESHGFGCYSVLEGKICTSVSIADALVGMVKGLENNK